MPPVTIDTPPCPTGTVASNFTYTGTYDLTHHFKPPFSKDNPPPFQVRLGLRIAMTNPGGVLKTVPDQIATCTTPVNLVGTWKCPSADMTQGGGVTATATLYVGNPLVAVNPPYPVTDYIIGPQGTMSTSCDVSSIAEDKAAAHAAPAYAATKIEQPLASALGDFIGRPDGFAVRAFAGEYRLDLSDPIVDIRARIERRYPDDPLHPHIHRRLTKSVAPAVFFGGGKWLAVLLVPTTQPSGITDFFIAEFFTANGLWAQQSPDVRPI
jgi:hypothetical protein